MKEENELNKLNIYSIKSVNPKQKKSLKKIYLVFFICFINIIFITKYCNKIKILILGKPFDNSKVSFTKRKNLNIFNKQNIDSIFDDKTNNDYLKNQKDFCVNQNIINYLNENIQIVKADYYNIKFNMLVYRGKDILSNFILRNKCWDPEGTKNIIDALDFYHKKTKSNKNDIYMLDLGANVGWYSLFFGKLGYNIIAFEPSIKNYQIFKMNYCLNQDANITIINKGLNIENKNCTLFHPLNNIGNAILMCEEKQFVNKNNFGEKIKLTKLSNYIPYLMNKNLAMIKIDVEGSEGKAIESGIDLFKKYHVPFIHLEFSPFMLRNKNTDPQLFLEIFEQNGYKFSKVDFLSKNYTSIDELLKTKSRQINIFLVYTKFLE